MRVVEREQARLDLRDREAGDRAGEFRRHQKLFGRAVLLLLVGEFGDHQAVGDAERGLQRVGQAVAEVLLHRDAVDHDLDVVLQLLVERRHRTDLVIFAVDLDALEALLLQLGEFLAVLALAAAHHRRQQIEARAFGQGEDAVGHLADGLALDRKPGGGRIGHADAREQEAQIVVDLGDGADRRARIARGRLLLDGDGGRQALDMVDIGLLHQFEELPGIGRQRFDIAALALGIDRVEGEAGLARTRKPGQHRQRIARNLDIDILEVVLAGAADGNVLQHLCFHFVETRTLAVGSHTRNRVTCHDPRESPPAADRLRW